MSQPRRKRCVHITRRRCYLDHDAASDGQVSVKPRVPDPTAIALHAHLEAALLGPLGPGLHLKQPERRKNSWLCSCSGGWIQNAAARVLTNTRKLDQVRSTKHPHPPRCHLELVGCVFQEQEPSRVKAAFSCSALLIASRRV